MSLIELFILALGLSMDAFAVSVCKGLSLGKIKVKHMCIAGAWFGGFQALMPLIGYLLGSIFADKITMYSHWIAFILLVIIGQISSSVSGTWIAEVVTWISFESRYDPFTQGQFNLSSVVYFISVMAVFVFFTTRKIESRRYR